MNSIRKIGKRAKTTDCLTSGYESAEPSFVGHSQAAVGYFYVAGAISFGPQIVVGAFAPWGWGTTMFGWRDHRILTHDHPWERSWVNRLPPPPPRAERRIERHETREYRRPERHEGGRGREEYERR